MVGRYDNKRLSYLPTILMFRMPLISRDNSCKILYFCHFSIMDANEFEWESQLRFYWQKEPDELIVRQCTGEFGYGYEYMGLNGRLVITPLTDRIYLTLTQVGLVKY